jgi:hypothetical protein
MAKPCHFRFLFSHFPIKWRRIPVLWILLVYISCHKLFVRHYLNPGEVFSSCGLSSSSMLILKFLQLRSRFSWSLSNLIALLRHQLFVYRDLFTWLDNPFEGPPALTQIDSKKLAFNLAK